MSMKKIYRCNLCREIYEPEFLTGLNFTTLSNFKLDSARSTDGSHICDKCLIQIHEQVNDRIKHIEEKAHKS